MPTRHRNSKSHKKKSLRNKGQKGGAKLEKNNKKLSNITDNIQDLDGATYTQDIMNKHSYKIRVFKPNMTYDDFKTEVNFKIVTDYVKSSTFIEKLINNLGNVKNQNNTLQINNNNITEFTLLWNFNDSKTKIDTPITISVPFYETPVDIKIDSNTKCILFNSNNIYTFSFSATLPGLDVQDAGGMIQPDKIVEYYKSQAFGIKTAIGKAATTIGTAASKYMETNKPILTTAQNVMSADLTGAGNRCTYTFTDAEQKQVLDLLGEKPGPTFSANLSFDGGKLTLATK